MACDATIPNSNSSLWYLQTNIKVKVTWYMPTQAQQEGWVTAQTYLQPRTRNVCFQYHAPACLPSRKNWYPLKQRLAGLRGRSGWHVESCSPPEFDPLTVQPVASRPTDYTIAATNKYGDPKSDTHRTALVFKNTGERRITQCKSENENRRLILKAVRYAVAQPIMARLYLIMRYNGNGNHTKCFFSDLFERGELLRNVT
jgi:hypothetical protein